MTPADNPAQPVYPVFDFSPAFWETIRRRLYGKRGERACRRAWRGLCLDWDAERCRQACEELDRLIDTREAQL